MDFPDNPHHKQTETYFGVAVPDGRGRFRAVLKWRGGRRSRVIARNLSEADALDAACAIADLDDPRYYAGVFGRSIEKEFGVDGGAFDAPPQPLGPHHAGDGG